jgi:ABC-type protease/lipase transport system fused ATPase/permease subunit
MMPVMDIVTYMMHVVIYMMPVMDIVIYMSCIWFSGIFGREKQKKIKKIGQFVVRRGAGARQIDLKGLPE